MGRQRWMGEPEDHDFPAALDYLSLVMPAEEAARLVQRLREAALSTRKAKDLLRASGLPLLAPDNPDVAKDLARVKAKRKLSPVLIVRGDLTRQAPLTVADGYHRICASYHIDEDQDIPCRLIDLVEQPAPGPPAPSSSPGTETA